MIAVETGQWLALEFMLMQGCLSSDELSVLLNEAVTIHGNTLLQISVQFDQAFILQQLLLLGADPEWLGETNLTALAVAINHDNEQLSWLLLKHGARLNNSVSDPENNPL
jgi:ankyrin repeat protein